MKPVEFYSTFMAFFIECMKNKMILFVIFAVVFDCMFGFIRSLREHKTNSTVGIDGIIRKVAMLASICFLAILDRMASINMIGLLPDDVQKYLPVEIGTVTFFGLLYLAFECVSVLKNMYLCGLPVKWVWVKVYNFLKKYTSELPDQDEDDMTAQMRKMAADIRGIRAQIGGEENEETGTYPESY